MALASGLFTSTRPDWETPRDVFAHFDERFRFTLDVCASPANTKCSRFFSVEEDGLAQSWAGERCWCNPPYGSEIFEWMLKASTEGTRAPIIACLVPARTDTRWWHWHVAGKAKVIFLRGRVRFVGGKGRAPFPSAVAVYGQEAEWLPAVEYLDWRVRRNGLGVTD